MPYLVLVWKIIVNFLLKKDQWIIWTFPWSVQTNRHNQATFPFFSIPNYTAHTTPVFYRQSNADVLFNTQGFAAWTTCVNAYSCRLSPPFLQQINSVCKVCFPWSSLVWAPFHAEGSALDGEGGWSLLSFSMLNVHAGPVYEQDIRA